MSAIMATIIYSVLMLNDLLTWQRGVFPMSRTYCVFDKICCLMWESERIFITSSIKYVGFQGHFYNLWFHICLFSSLKYAGYGLTNKLLDCQSDFFEFLHSIVQVITNVPLVEEILKPFNFVFAIDPYLCRVMVWMLCTHSRTQASMCKQVWERKDEYN